MGVLSLIKTRLGKKLVRSFYTPATTPAAPAAAPVAPTTPAAAPTALAAAPTTTLAAAPIRLLRASGQSRLQGQGYSILDIAWSTSAIANLQDAMTAMTNALSSNQKPAEPDSDEDLPAPWQYQITGIDRCKLNMANIVPSLGFFNRNGALCCV